MSEKVIPLLDRQTDDAKLLAQISVAELRQIVRDEITKSARTGTDRLVDIEEAAQILNVSTEWIYRHRKTLPFARKLGRKLLKFSVAGIHKYIAANRV